MTGQKGGLEVLFRQWEEGDAKILHSNSEGKRMRTMYTVGDKRNVASVGVEPTTFALLARRSNQLS